MFEHIVNSVYIPFYDVKWIAAAVCQRLDMFVRLLSWQFYDVSSEFCRQSITRRSQIFCKSAAHWPGKTWHRTLKHTRSTTRLLPWLTPEAEGFINLHRSCFHDVWLKGVRLRSVVRVMVLFTILFENLIKLLILGHSATLKIRLLTRYDVAMLNSNVA